jgi:hypothetical protein
MQMGKDNLQGHKANKPLLNNKTILLFVLWALISILLSIFLAYVFPAIFEIMQLVNIAVPVVLFLHNRKILRNAALH